MKKLICALLALMLLCTAAMAEIEFSTVDTEGNRVTQAIFEGYDLTMVNVWATWCGYCIDELPEFTALKESLPENCNLITICDDAASEPELTAAILDLVSADFTTLAASEDMYSGILSGVYAFPTTFFVDGGGNIVGEAVVGVPSLDDPAGAYYDIMMERLEMLS